MSDKIEPLVGGFSVSGKPVSLIVDDGPPMVQVRGDVLAPLLVYINKFFKCVTSHNANGLSRFMHANQYELDVHLRGFSPEDWNGMMSLAKSAGVELEELLDSYAGKTPQMAKPELRRAENGGRGRPGLGEDSRYSRRGRESARTEEIAGGATTSGRDRGLREDAIGITPAGAVVWRETEEK